MEYVTFSLQKAIHNIQKMKFFDFWLNIYLFGLQNLYKKIEIQKKKKFAGKNL